MFRLIPLRSVTRNSNIKVDTLTKHIPNNSGIHREILSPNTISPVGSENITKDFNDTFILGKSVRWYANDYEKNNLLVLSGSRELELYCDVKKKKETLVINEDNIYRNGKLYYGSPAMISWYGCIYHRTTSGKDGCLSINITEESYSIQEIKVPHSQYKLKNLSNTPIYDKQEWSMFGL